VPLSSPERTRSPKRACSFGACFGLVAIVSWSAVVHAEDLPPAAASASSATAATTGRPPAPLPFRLDAGLGIRPLYGVPFVGGHGRVATGGRVGSSGRTRLYGFGSVFVGRDRTSFRLTSWALGVMVLRHLTDRFYLGVSVETGVANIAARSVDFSASSVAATGHLGFDLLPVRRIGALFVEAAPSRAYYGGHVVGGADSWGVALGLGVRL
jgi:hypothetical protein